MRAFLAMELPTPVKEALAQETSLMRRAGARVAWVRPDGLHLTLRFLGTVYPEQQIRLTAHLESVLARHAPVRLAVAGLGAFPQVRQPTVVWAGVRTVAGDLAGIQQALEQAAQALGWPQEGKAFHPHVTLARVRDLARVGQLTTVLAERAALPLVFGEEFTVDQVVLFSSELAPGGAIYTPEAVFKLGMP